MKTPWRIFISAPAPNSSEFIQIISWRAFEHQFVCVCVCVCVCVTLYDYELLKIFNKTNHEIVEYISLCFTATAVNI